MKYIATAKPEKLLRTNKSQPALEVAWLDPVNKQLVVTDRHALVVLPITPDQDDREGHITKDALVLAGKVAKIQKSGLAEVAATVDALDAAQPPYAQWLKKPEFNSHNVKYTIDVKLLLEACQAAGFERDGKVIATLHVTGEDLVFGPMKATSGIEGSGVAYVMPTRI